MCRVVCDLDEGGTLRRGEYDDAIVDLQLFYARMQSGSRLPWLLSVRLGVERKGDGGDKGLWQRRKLLGMMFEDEERFGGGSYGSVSGEGEMGPGSNQRPLDAVDLDDNVGASGFLEDTRMFGST